MEYLTYQTATFGLLALPLLATLKVIVQYLISSRLASGRLRRLVGGKNIVVTGGSKGLGKGIARVLVDHGANVALVARGHESLVIAQKELRERTTATQQVLIQALDLSSFDTVKKAVRDLRAKMGNIDWVIHNAGSAVPGFLADQLDREAEAMIASNYLATANVVRAFVAVAKELAEDKKQEPTARTWPISGLSAAAQEEIPENKYAQRGFADALRSEFAPLGVNVHLYLPANMDTPGFKTEGETKPEITAQIEGAAVTATPEDAAKALLAGVVAGRYLICNDILGELIRISAQGGVPRPNPVTEALAAPIISLAFSIWSTITEYEVRTYFSKARPATASKKSD
ncbi:UNVERIFIED_CONTAM: 3-dehydrosphinganine reductase [Siphonaria sp. JEL0065]|nr:3-dehydrosphinganine reductase [Siphonaria sp. JEL0065]